MKKALSSIILTIMLILVSSPAYAATKQIEIDGVAIASDVKPETKNNRTMVPIRIISENLGARVDWAHSDSEVTLTKHNMKVTVKPNSSIAVKNGESILMDVKPYVKKNRLFVPLRFIAETFGCTVDYSNSTVTIHTAPLVIDGTKVGALQQEYHMTMGGVVQQINGNAYIEAIYKLLVDNKGKQIEAPVSYSWRVNYSEPGSYYKNAQYDFLGEKGKSLQRFDIYSSFGGGSYDGTTDHPSVVIHDPSEDQWYEFSAAASDSIWNLIYKASENGFQTVIKNTVA
ncbi:copper amine oxidase N-terminal domain-containing protein [Gorillibacterium timonense]|uniref:copper amine oxidase N-terminal domain-containing protein n=1 Tax=Gorillibacterium timonense TaxID=1689269 RepID=UPI00071E03DE|nr:copper amine oxidase N-terminal domain-containing protein [Gorillibacterium timonense]